MKLKRSLLQSNGIVKEKIKCFCENETDVVHEMPQGKKDVSYVINMDTSSTLKNVPKCPTCGSESVEKISLGSKVVGGAMWGIFSSNIRKSYKCNNCGYKW